MRKALRCGLAAIAFTVMPFIDPLVMAQWRDFPIWCRGSFGMASTSGQNLVVDFTPADGPADDRMDFGRCSWLDRALGPDEPNRIVYQMSSNATAQTNANEINRGGFWTFWVFNEGQFLKATVFTVGARTQKPQPIDQ